MENSAREIIARLRDGHRLSSTEYLYLLEDTDSGNNAFLASEAGRVSRSVFGNGIFIRGLIEVSNHCKNNCLYCGIRAGNISLDRYRMDKKEIMECCRNGYELGFRTFVLQGGEDPIQTDEWVEDVVRGIRSSFPDCAITLSLGEKTKEAYAAFRQAGADRYLLRHETFNPVHYSKLHPSPMKRGSRLECLSDLKELGYQTGTGIMVGSPYQTLENVVEDLLFIQTFEPQMIGMGPFVHHNSTPFADFSDGSVDMTLKLISICRLMNPNALIPATTSLATLDGDGVCKGILAGANVVMPNLSPLRLRGKYDLYEGKAASGTQAAEGLAELGGKLDAIGYRIAAGRGDYNNVVN